MASRDTQMNAAKSKKFKKKRKAAPTPQQLQAKEARAHRNGIESFLKKIGFKKTNTDGIKITFEGRAGEFDAIFHNENVILIVEYTIGKPGSDHLLKKKVLFDHVLNKPAEFIHFCKKEYEGFSESIGNLYSAKQFQVRVLYASKQEPSEELQNTCNRFFFIHGARDKYFQSLAKTIEISARVEFLKFLKIPHDRYGKNAIQNATNHSQYDGLLLPEENSSYPAGHRIVSFYADAEGLIDKSYVLRRDSWREDSHHLYQRILISRKIRGMRRYLNEEGRVFVNNIIVTLPSETELRDPQVPQERFDDADASKPRRVKISIPAKFDVIGIIDGQHRVFCYHEGTDQAESNVRILRQKQNLLVTGIIYPKGIKDGERSRFEAKLFLEINDNQARAKSSLKQDIEILINPYSSMAISKRVIQGLGKSGPLKGLLQTGHFDGPEMIKTSSIVSYGLRPLVKLDGDDSLFFSWKNPKKEQLKSADNDNQEELLNEYIKYCVVRINELLVAIKTGLTDQSRWERKTSKNNGVLSPTTLNGIIILLREIIRARYDLSFEQHKARLRSLDKFQFSKYKSSQWKSMGTDIYSKHYSG